MSPATNVRIRVGARPPDVGFWRLLASGISSSETEHTARNGVPFWSNSVYFAFTDFKNATNSIVLPHENRTNGGNGDFWSVGG